MVAVGIWLLFTTFVIILIIHQDLRKASLRFEEITHLLYSDIYRRIQSNEVVLEGFAALIGLIGDSNLKQVESYANQMLSRYPHIYELEIVRRVSREELNAFEASMSQYQIPGFRIKSFAYEDDRTWRSVDDKPFYYPIVYITPTLPESLEVFGLDMDSVPFLRDVMHESTNSRHPVATEPFHLVQGDRAYVMFKAVGDRHDDSSVEQERITGGGLYALQVIKAEQMLPRELLDPLELEITLYHADYSEQTQKGWFIRHQPKPRFVAETFLLPNLRFSQTVDVSSQPFVFSASKQLGWNDISSGLLIAIQGISVMALSILLAYGNAYRRNDRARRFAESRRLQVARRVEIVKKQGEVRYRSLVCNLPIGVFRATFDPQGRFVTVNPAMASIFGYTLPEDILSTNCFALFQDRGDWKSLVGECLNKGRVAREVRLIGKDDKQLWGGITVSAVRDKTAKEQYLDGFIEDITLRKGAQDKLIRSEQRFHIEDWGMDSRFDRPPDACLE